MASNIFEESIGDTELFGVPFAGDTFNFDPISDSLDSLKSLAEETYYNSAPTFTPAQEQELISKIPGVPGTKGASELLASGLKSGAPNVAAFTGGFYTGQADALKGIREKMLSDLAGNRAAREAQDKALGRIDGINKTKISLRNSQRAEEVARTNRASTLQRMRIAEQNRADRVERQRLVDEEINSKIREQGFIDASKSVATSILSNAWDKFADEENPVSRFNLTVDDAVSQIDVDDRVQVAELGKEIDTLKKTFFSGITQKKSASTTGLTGLSRKNPSVTVSAAETELSQEPERDQNSLREARKAAESPAADGEVRYKINPDGSATKKPEGTLPDEIDAPYVFPEPGAGRDLGPDRTSKPTSILDLPSPREAGAAEIDDVFGGFIDGGGFDQRSDDNMLEILKNAKSGERDNIAASIAIESRTLGVQPDLIGSMIISESNGNQKAKSSVGAVGLMQLLPSTFKEVMPGGDIHDPKDNVAAGTRYLSKMIDQFKTIPMALAAYNAGPGNARKIGPDIMRKFPETKKYIIDVMGRISETTGGPTVESLMAEYGESESDAKDRLINLYIMDAKNG